MRVTKTLTISTIKGVLTVTVSLPAKSYTGKMEILSAYWTGVIYPLDGDVSGVISWGDGTSDTILMPIANTNYSISHTYSATGTKAVSVVVTDAGSGATGTGSASIIINAPLSVASFTATPLSGPAPLAVTFTIGAISGGFTPYTGTLAYGDGVTDPVSAAGTKVHTYTTVGTFTATLTVTDALGATIVRKVGTTVTGDPKADLENYVFPTSALVDEAKTWSAVVHNIGETGTIGFGIVNSAGPGDVVVTYAGEEFAISPGNYLRIYKDAVPYCDRVSVSGTVKFKAAGTYTIKLWALHESIGEWYYDQEVVRSVSVTVTPPPAETLWDKIVKFVKDNPLVVAGILVGGVVLWKSEK